jgi:ABC-type glycerol-3-phosphate transport system substrate-binding protein
LLDSGTALEAFETHITFFTNYGTPVTYDFLNRFRSGEMPLGIADYTLFNTFEVFAPEIRGEWAFALIPGTVTNGVLNRSTTTGSTASVLYSGAKQSEQAWEFLKWWISGETQLRYGRELESVMGASARYATANTTAFSRLPWNVEQMAILNEQRSWTVGTPEVVGGYYVSRHLANAARRIYNNKEGIRETLLDYTFTINDELERKRQEFGIN